VWVANSLDLTVSKIDPATDRVTALIGVGDGPGAIVAAGNAIWVSDEFDATLDRIDLRSGKVTRNVFVGSSPRAWPPPRPACGSRRGHSRRPATAAAP
jgi:YVTN family beta-propeller protein